MLVHILHPFPIPGSKSLKHYKIYQDLEWGLQSMNLFKNFTLVKNWTSLPIGSEYTDFCVASSWSKVIWLLHGKLEAKWAADIFGLNSWSRWVTASMERPLPKYASIVHFIKSELQKLPSYYEVQTRDSCLASTQLLRYRINLGKGRHIYR